MATAWTMRQQAQRAPVRAPVPQASGLTTWGPKVQVQVQVQVQRPARAKAQMPLQAAQ